MKRLLFLALVFFFGGCAAHYPLATNLSLQVGGQTAGIYSANTTASLTGHDGRKDSAVVVYRLTGDPEVAIPNGKEPHVLITEQLAAGLKQQGLVFAKGSPVHIELDINELVATVTRPKLLYKAKARSSIKLSVHNRETTLTRIYNREADRESATRPDVADLEKMLDAQLSEIVDQIFKDQEVRSTIGAR